ncbi:glycine cleavage system aminomethyltransferase GcvT [Microbacterium sp.]|uniref:glycine cleavage system aminomethyltransferase GcvT n=1 Tax=Microbacterium sp. TaxID=51671 RepID=UPI003A9432BB
MSHLRQTPLNERHEALGASFTDFGGWSMPVRYTSDLTEHRAVREAAGLFDISHMAEFLVTGRGAGAFLDYALAGCLSALAVGKAKYSLVLADDGGIIDDVIVYRTGDESYLVVANAGNRDAVAQVLAEEATRAPVSAVFTPQPAAVTSFVHIDVGDHVRIEDVTDQLALVAVQGPVAEQIVRETAGIDIPDLDGLGYYAWREGRFADALLFAARTGYTGEDGFELMVPAAQAGALWDALLAAGAPLGLIPCGLAARDTLRLEAGMPLYGHELRRDIVPAQAGLGRVVVMAKDDFVGKAGLAARDATDDPVLVGLAAEGRRAGRAGYAVLGPDGAVVGEITSGALSPTLGHPIALAFVPPAFAEPGTALSIDVRGTGIPATVTTLPFYRRTK